MADRAGDGPPVVFVDGAIPEDLADVFGEQVLVVGPDDADLTRAVAVVCGKRLWDGALMDLAPHLRVISKIGVGYDNVDVEAATARGIAVCHTADAPTVSTAEHTIALLLGITKLLPAWGSDAQTRTRRLPSGSFGVELHGRTLGLFGFGRIGRRVATAARALGMRVIAHDPFLVPRSAGGDAELVELADLWARSDIVSLHAPATPSTYRIAGRAAFAAMPPGGFLVNCARGSLVDHAALLDALDSGQLAAAGLDVTDPEPLPEGHPLLTHPRVLLTPHVASATTSGRRRLYADAVANTLAALAGDVTSTVPEQRPPADRGHNI
jgi:phosphoglycerate dehydrogenase-like enzyme